MSCKECDQRHPGCHSECEEYADFLQENEERKLKIRGWREKESLYANTREKVKRKKNRRGQW